jgi:hypothetical protein
MQFLSASCPTLELKPTALTGHVSPDEAAEAGSPGEQVADTRRTKMSDWRSVVDGIPLSIFRIVGQEMAPPVDCGLRV